MGTLRLSLSLELSTIVLASEFDKAKQNTHKQTNFENKRSTVTVPATTGGGASLNSNNRHYTAVTAVTIQLASH